MDEPATLDLRHLAGTPTEATSVWEFLSYTEMDRGRATLTLPITLRKLQLGRVLLIYIVEWALTGALPVWKYTIFN